MTLEGPVGFEPTTPGLKVRSSTAELQAPDAGIVYIFGRSSNSWDFRYELHLPFIVTSSSRPIVNIQNQKEELFAGAGPRARHPSRCVVDHSRFAIRSIGRSRSVDHIL